MDTFQTILTNQVRDALVTAGFAATAAEVTPATDPRFGDYQTNAAMAKLNEMFCCGSGTTYVIDHNRIDTKIKERTVDAYHGKMLDRERT